MLTLLKEDWHYRDSARVWQARHFFCIEIVTLMYKSRRRENPSFCFVNISLKCRNKFCF